MIVVSIAAALYAGRGILRALRSFIHNRNRDDQ
jgi:hypothetical protein